MNDILLSPFSRERPGPIGGCGTEVEMQPPKGFLNRLRRCRDGDLTLLIAGKNVVTSSTIDEMFKFDFIQDGGDEQTQTAQNTKKEPNEPALTEISLIELVRTPRFSLLIPNGDSFSVRHFAPSHLLLPSTDTVIGEPSRTFSLSARSL